MHQNSWDLFRMHGIPLLQSGMDVLEVGPDWLVPGGMCKPLVEACGCNYSFADIKNPPGGLAMADEYTVVCDDGRFDVVFSLSVAEHVRRLWTWARELKRITRPGGLIVFVNPVSWPFHPSPYDCWRIMPDGYKALFEEVGLEHQFSWTGNVAPLEPHLAPEHGPHQVTDTVAIARVPVPAALEQGGP